MTVEGALEYDGMLDYRITVRALQDVAVDDIALPDLPGARRGRVHAGPGPEGREAAAAASTGHWKVENHQEGVWLGGHHSGPAVRAARRRIRAAAEHELLPEPAAADAGVMVQRGTRRHPDRDEPTDAVTALELLRPADAGGRRHAPLQRPLPAHAVQADRHANALRHALRAPVRPGRFRARVGWHGGQHPPRQRDQPLHQLPVLQPRPADGLHRRGAREGHQGQALLHDPGADLPGARAVRAAKPGRRDPERRRGRRALVDAGAPRGPLPLRVARVAGR